MSAPTRPSLFERAMTSSWNYWFMLVTDVLAAAGFLLIGIRRTEGIPVVLLAVGSGVAAWSPVEYAMHRWVLHGPSSSVQRAHARHHRHADALIAAPAFLSTSLAVALWVALSSWLNDGTAALAVGGLYCGYNYYALLHHVQHHHPGLVARVSWLARLDRSHRLHHRFYVVNYGVTSAWCDRLFRSDVRSSRVVSRRLAQAASPLPQQP